MIAAIRLFALAIALLMPGLVPAQADTLRPGYMELRQMDEARWNLVWKAPMRGGVRPETRPVLPDNCKITGEPAREMQPLAVITRMQLTCNGSLAGKDIGLSNFTGAITDIIVRYIPLADGQGRAAPQALRLTAAQPSATIAETAGRGQVAWSYFVIGIEHIVFGPDHLLFVLCLVLLIRGGWNIAKTVTAFTIAHSITLAGTVLGWFGLPQQPVEVVIALSIVFLAVEIIKRKEGEPRLSERIPWVVAFAFGLLHGFGFAGALNEIGLPEGEVPTALLTFNLGVEAGQLAIVVVAMALIALLKRIRPAAMRPVTQVMTYAIGILASVWLIERMFA